MKSDFLIVSKDILPSFFDDIIAARELVEVEGNSVSDACKIQNISRSTYYKYKDYVFKPSNYYGKRAILAIRMSNSIGTLSKILNHIASHGGNIVAIHQESNVGSKAYATITIDILNMDIKLAKLQEELVQQKITISTQIIALE